MLEKTIEWSINNRILVLIGIVALIFAGVVAIQQTPVDAIPDLSDVQVIILTEYPGQGRRSGHVSSDHGHALRALCQGRTRLFVFRIFNGLYHL